MPVPRYLSVSQYVFPNAPVLGKGWGPLFLIMSEICVSSGAFAVEAACWKRSSMRRSTEMTTDCYLGR